MTMAELEQRLALLEREVAALKPRPANINAWIDEIHGTIPDNAVSRQAEEFGRQWRKSGKKVARKSRSK